MVRRRTTRPDRRSERRYGWPHAAVAGVDEAGRGAWAGPVVAAAACLPDLGDLPLADSKDLTPRARERLFAILVRHPHGVGVADVEEIDAVNVLKATHLAMRRALAGLPYPPAHVLVDGDRVPEGVWPASALIGGDATSAVIAAASVLAKVSRDRMMLALDRTQPQYGWIRNKGYGTPEHAAALARWGPGAHHRRSFAPVRSAAVVFGDGGGGVFEA